MVKDLKSLDALRVDLATLRRRGVDHYDLPASLPVAWLAAVLSDTDAQVSSEGRVELVVLLQPEGIVVAQGSLTLAFSVPCGRCLSPAAVDGGVEIFATFLPGAPEPDRGDGEGEEEADEDFEPDPASADVWRYEGSILRLDALVAEQVALGYPMRALCELGESCRGLCSNCGQELNELDASTRRCPKCGNEVPLTPVADLPGTEPDEAALSDQREERKEDGPLAAALRKLKLD